MVLDPFASDGVTSFDLEAAVAETRRSARIPALAGIRLSSDGVEEVVLDGVRRIDRPERVAPTDRFHLGSNTKAMTALVAALAVEQGAIAWDTTAAAMLDIGAPTLRQLLTHSAGLHPYGEDEDVARAGSFHGSPPEQRAAFAKHALSEPPLFAPGTAHAYSNAGYATAAAMVEAATGEAWEDAVERRIFAPLGIDGPIGWPVEHVENAPLGHRIVDGALQPHDPADDGYALPIWCRPAGDVCISPGDYGTFLADQLAGLRGRGWLGGAELYRSLHVPDPPDEPGETGYALGWGVRDTSVGPVSQHTGSADTFYAVVVLQTDADRGLALLANSYSDEHERAVNAIAKAFLLHPP